MLRENARVDPSDLERWKFNKSEEREEKKSSTEKGIRPDNHNPIYFYSCILHNSFLIVPIHASRRLITGKPQKYRTSLLRNQSFSR